MARLPMARLQLLAATLNVWVLVLILVAAFGAQFIAGEPPCPLCVMQRIALMLCALGPLSILIRARAQNAAFVGARLDHADLSHADLSGADLRDASFFHANLHALRDKGALWTGASTVGARATDIDRLEAEAWMPPQDP